MKAAATTKKTDDKAAAATKKAGVDVLADKKKADKADNDAAAAKKKNKPKSKKEQLVAVAAVRDVGDVLARKKAPAEIFAVNFDDDDSASEEDVSEERTVSPHERSLVCKVCKATKNSDASRNGYVYVLSDLRACYQDEHVGALTRFKVGASFNPYERVVELQTGNPDLILFAYFHVGNCTPQELDRIEHVAHRNLQQYQISHLFSYAREFFAFEAPEQAVHTVRDVIVASLKDKRVVCEIVEAPLATLNPQQRLLVLMQQAAPFGPPQPFMLEGGGMRELYETSKIVSCLLPTTIRAMLAFSIPDHPDCGKRCLRGSRCRLRRDKCGECHVPTCSRFV